MPTIIDLGRQKKKHIKALKRGEGVLATQVAAALPQGADSTVVLVREKHPFTVATKGIPGIKAWRKMGKKFGFTKLFTG